MEELSLTVQDLLDKVRHYDVKKLLLMTNAAGAEVDRGEYAALVNYFISELTKTRMEKVAILAKSKAAPGFKEKNLLNSSAAEIVFQHFVTQEEAFGWLEE